MARSRHGDKKTVPIESVKHKDKRKNIPTEELGKFLTDEDRAPKEVKYPGLR